MASKTEYLTTLQATIKLKHRCRAAHRETISVHETTGKQTVWKGDVEVFHLDGHKKSKICYAWSHAKPNGEVKLITVLGSRAIDSAKRAVRAAIFMDAQPITSLQQRDEL